MTTNHRPALESKRGKLQPIKDSIAHARALPQQTGLKKRKQLPSRLTETAVSQLKQELLQLEERLQAVKKHIDTTDTATTALEEENKEAKPLETADEVSEKSSKGDSEESDYSSDSDVDTEELLQELAQIRRDKEHQKEEVSDGLEEATGSSKEKPKKSWRNSTPFNTKATASSNDPSNTFTTDALSSDYHKSFLSKYIR